LVQDTVDPKTGEALVLFKKDGYVNCARGGAFNGYPFPQPEVVVYLTLVREIEDPTPDPASPVGLTPSRRLVLEPPTPSLSEVMERQTAILEGIANPEKKTAYKVGEVVQSTF